MTIVAPPAVRHRAAHMLGSTASEGSAASPGALGGPSAGVVNELLLGRAG
ncbi:hypothetical protein [Actinacidiphila oryziradicis]|nr:hypothetical protein [Actinacidiphila oryziradicis]